MQWFQTSFIWRKWIKLTADKHMEPATHSLPNIRILPSILLWNLKAWRLGMCGFWQNVTRGTWGQDREGEGGDRLCWRDAVSLQLRSNCMFIIVRVGCLLVTDCWCSNGMIIGQCQQRSTDCKVLFCLFYPYCLIHSTSEKKMSEELLTRLRKQWLEWKFVMSDKINLKSMSRVRASTKKRKCNSKKSDE